MVIAPEAVPVHPLVLGLVIQNVLIGDGGLSEIVVGHDLTTVPAAVAHPQRSEAQHVLTGRENSCAVAEDVLPRLFGQVEIAAKDSETARETMFDAFGYKWAFQYTEDSYKPDYFPRGVVLKLGEE